MRNNIYWERRKSMQQKAAEHTQLMTQLYQKETENSIKNSTIYNTFFESAIGTQLQDPFVQIIDEDSVSAIFSLKKKFPDKKICVLNFSSYKNPGGKFIEGSSAQEECLCHASNLYNCLIRFDKTFYEPHRRKGATNQGLYKDQAIYLPNVVFTREGETAFVDVLTCAAPNWSAANEYFNVPWATNKAALIKRIKFIRNIMEKKNVEIAILGAYGCGVFGQDPMEVAKLFDKNFGYETTIQYVYYAIPKNLNEENYNIFKRYIVENTEIILDETQLSELIQ